MRLSVIICAYTMNRWTALVDAVNSCFAQTRTPDEIILVIDYNEELRERAAAEFPDVRVIANDMTKGLSGARNTGVIASSGDVLAFLDDDAFAETEWLENLAKAFEDPLVAGSGGWILPHWEGPQPRWFPRTFLWILGCSYEGLPENNAPIRNPIGANMALRRSVFEVAGGFSAGLGRIGTTPLGCEETELCIRYNAHRSDDIFILVRGAVVHHRVPASRCTWSYFLRRCWSEGLSKAAVASLVGNDAGLSAERRHVAKALPLEIITSFNELKGNPLSLLRRTVSIVGGSLVAAAGFLKGARAVKASPISLQSAILEGVSDPTESEVSHEWRPISIVQLDIDDVPDGIIIPPDLNDRVWIEVMREGQVMGREELQSQDHRVSGVTLRQVAQRFAQRVPSFIDVADESLPSISIVVPTICKYPEELERFVRELASLDYPNFEVIIVDNRVDPDSQVPVYDSLDNVKVVAERIPGISAARNRGIMEASFDIVAFTDDDVIVDSRWLRAIGGRFWNDPHISALGGLVLPAELATQPQVWFEEYFGGFSQSFDLRFANRSHHPLDPLFPYAAGRYAAGCNMAFRRSVLEAQRGFRLTLGTGTPAFGGEDLEMFVTIASGGDTVAFEPAALVRHIHRATEEQFLAQARGYGAGLIAMYVALIAHDPRHLFAMSRRAWKGFRGLKSSRDDRSISAMPSYPVNTRGVEVRGMLYGPVAYWKSRRMFHHLRQSVARDFGDAARV